MCDDYEAIFKSPIQQIQDAAIIGALAAIIPDKKSADVIIKYLNVFISNGVSAEIAIKIMSELADMTCGKGE